MPLEFINPLIGLTFLIIWALVGNVMVRDIRKQPRETLR